MKLKSGQIKTKKTKKIRPPVAFTCATRILQHIGNDDKMHVIFGVSKSEKENKHTVFGSFKKSSS